MNNHKYNHNNNINSHHSNKSNNNNKSNNHNSNVSIENAESVIRALKGDGGFHEKLTTNQIRNILSQTARLYDRSYNNEFEKLKPDIDALKIQLVYQSGRNEGVRQLVERAGLVGALKNVHKTEDLQKFCQYVEALVAYFKYLGGKN
jgi:CRISPR-associated protein Csm2